MQLEVGNIVEGKITGITAFGAFVQLEGGATGLVHISEVALTYVKDIKDHLKENETVKVKVLTIDKNGKVSLSIKKALESEAGNKRPTSGFKSKPTESNFKRNNTPPAPLTFEDKLNRFKLDSDERMLDLKRNVESKRGGSYKRSGHSF